MSGQSGIYGNEKVNELARNGSSTKFIGPEIRQLHRTDRIFNKGAPPKRMGKFRNLQAKPK